MTRTRTLFQQVIAALLVAVLPALTSPAFAQYAPQQGSYLTRVAGRFVAANYGTWHGKVVNGNGSTGSSSITVDIGTGIALPDGRNIMPFSVTAPVTVGISTVAENVTPTAVSGCTYNAATGSQVCTITGSFTNLHGQGEYVQSATFGLAEAVTDAFLSSGGMVTVDQQWSQMGGTDTILAAAVPYQMVPIEDVRNGVPQYWTPTQTVATALAAPTTLIAATAGFSVNGANLTSGFYTGSSSYITCIAYVDIMGNEGPCSATFTIATSGSAATDQIGFTAPAASTGAVGYTIYISLASGTYNLTYQVPLTSTVCTLTKFETTTPACAVANTTYGQAGSGAVVSALTVNTAPLHLLATTASTTAAYIGTPSGRTTYAYVPHQNAGAPGLTVTQQPFAISPAPATTVPTVIATIPILPGFMNKVGRGLRICGEATNASGGTATIENIELLWDAAGSNTAGAPVIVGQMQITATQASSPENYSFCETLLTTVSGAGVTAGSLEPIFGNFTLSEAAGTLHAAGPDIKAAAVGSLNLAGTGGNTQRIHVVYLHTTGTDASGTTVQGLTVEAI